MTRRRAIATLARTTLCWLLAAPIAHASPFAVPKAWAIHSEPAGGSLRGPHPTDTDGDAGRREAAAAFADGEAAFDRGDYPTAATHFEHAQRLSPHPWTLYNLALSRARAGDPLAAWHAFDELAVQAGGEVERREALRERDALLPLLAVVAFRGAAGARACVDGHPIDLDADGRVEHVVMPGVHRITTIRRDDDVSLAAGARIEFDAGAARGPAGRVRPWLLVATAASATALLGSTAAAATADARATQGIAGAAAVASGVALGASIVALVRLHREHPRAATVRCTAPS